MPLRFYCTPEVETPSKLMTKKRALQARMKKYEKVLVRVTGTLIDNLLITNELLEQLKVSAPRSVEIFIS